MVVDRAEGSSRFLLAGVAVLLTFFEHSSHFRYENRTRTLFRENLRAQQDTDNAVEMIRAACISR